MNSTIGYSNIRIYNSDAQAPNAFKNGRYGSMNLRYSPFSDYELGAEFQWGKRNNFSDGFSPSIVKLQFSFKYVFRYSLFDDKK